MNLFVVAAVVVILLAMLGVGRSFDVPSRSERARRRRRHQHLIDEAAGAPVVAGYRDIEAQDDGYEVAGQEDSEDLPPMPPIPAMNDDGDGRLAGHSGDDSANTDTIPPTSPMPVGRLRSWLVIVAVMTTVALLFLALGYAGRHYLISYISPAGMDDHSAAAGYLTPADPCAAPVADVPTISAFIAAACYQRWLAVEPPRRLSGVNVDGIDYARHRYLQIYYSPKVATWLGNGRRGPLPDGSMIVALEYAAADAPKPQRILSRLKDRGGSHDGWFWSSITPGDPQTESSPAAGRFGASDCLACHSAADNTELVFLQTPIDAPVTAAATDSIAADKPPQTTSEGSVSWQPSAALRWPQTEPLPIMRRLPQPLPEADQGFLDQFGLPDIPAEQVVAFPGKIHDHVAAAGNTGDFITADQCIGCHSASRLLSNTRPALWYRNPNQHDDKDALYRDYSPYGEWSASLNALASRDPVWHAQVESERFMRPQLADFTDDTCFSCHAPMAGRQLRRDRDDPQQRFVNAMFYALPGEPYGKYGALARDGVSCMVCHTMSDDGLGVDPQFEPGAPHEHKHPDQLNSYTALFDVAAAIGGPYRDSNINAVTMKRATGLDAVYTDHTGDARLCGSCHTVIVPALPVDYQGSDPHNDPGVRLAFEQTTYWEWRNTVFQNEREPKGKVPAPCQVCHMFPHQKTRIANIENDEFPPLATRLSDRQLQLREQNPLWRHTLLAINLPVYKMFQQFPQLLGTRLRDPAVPAQTLDPLLNAEDWMNAFIDNKVVDLQILQAGRIADQLEITLQLTNFAGHKLPTGAGFRRAFIELRVLSGAGRVLWTSGKTNRYGVIVDGDGRPLTSEFTRDPNQSQPHHQVITHQDQVQIYETRSLDSTGSLQSTVLGIYREYKDNRLLPLGWAPDGPNIFATTPKLPAPAHRRDSDANIARAGDGSVVGRHNTNCYDGYDPDYCEAELSGHGQDHIRYRIFADAVKDWATIEARLWYQTIPPYYLAERFRNGQSDGEFGRDTKRLIHIASRLNLADSKIKDWKIQLGKTALFQKGEAARTGLSFEQALERVKIPNFY